MLRVGINLYGHLVQYLLSAGSNAAFLIDVIQISLGKKITLGNEGAQNHISAGLLLEKFFLRYSLIHAVD